ncbi:glycogen/starch/alpha-glucan family phosphorylase [Leptolyngbya sp. NK1-12]|uniref:Alpha-1,4 glucan phosphorylase n=1 Tax=Leptolyngbya sp. NK1-12 TaxID=2547451 RepID=A0AA96WC93_9CYAN|nr:glycogen/starch/alpha-glucan family phosphorylase [Leptolyngbya sp. NK1-12]WNZ22474.1 glycogen/starch/alpha-glucan family phosphorylase [Leptolyngbya sp. NK1-12]
MDSANALWLLPVVLLGAGLAVLTRGIWSSRSGAVLNLEGDGSESNLPDLGEQESQRAETETAVVNQPETIASTVKDEMNSTNENVIENTDPSETAAQQADQVIGVSEIEEPFDLAACLPDQNLTEETEIVKEDANQDADQFEEAQVTEAQVTDAQVINTGAAAESTESTADLATLKAFSSLNPADPSLEVCTASQVDSTPNPISAIDAAMAKIIPIATRESFNIRIFQQAFVDTLYHIRHRTPQTATGADAYVALAAMVRARLLRFSSTEPLAQIQPVRVEISPEYAVGVQLENHLANLGLFDLVRQALQELGLNLDQLCEQENWSEQETDGLGCLVGSNLEAYTTVGLAAIGYGIYSDDKFSEPDAPDALGKPDAPDKRDKPDDASSALDEHDLTRTIWELEQAASVEVKFGGHTEFYTDEQGHYRKRWVAAEVVQAVPLDLLISGYETETINRLRLWKANTALLRQPHSSPAVNPSDQQQELSWKQWFLLASGAVQDMIRLHLEAERPLESLPDHFRVQLNDPTTALTLAELMYQLVDEHQLDWEQAWSITEKLCSCRLYHLTATARGEQWPIELFNQLLPRHLEIIHEINRRFLDQVRSRFPADEERIGRMSLIDQSSGNLRMLHLACVGSDPIAGVYPLHTQLLQRTLLADFNDMYAERFSDTSAKITPRRFLAQANPRLTNLITQWLGNSWMIHPEQLQQLESLVDNAKFCGNWWEAKRAAKQDLVDYIHQQTGIAVNLNSLFDVQAMPIEANKRQLLNLLHIITLYARLKTNASTDTIQRFAHRSVPRTCLFVGAAVPNHPVAAAIAQLIRAVSDAINGDPDVQGRLQVIVLADNHYKTIRHVYAATDLAEQIPLADQDVPSLIPLQFALNGAITIGTPNSANLELRQAIGAKNLFLFGMTATEAERLNARYDPWQLYDTDPDLKQALDLIASGYFSYGDSSVFKPLIEWLINNDPNLVLADYQSYMNCQERISQAYQDQKNWTWMSILTIAQMGQFLSTP